MYINIMWRSHVLWIAENEFRVHLKIDLAVSHDAFIHTQAHTHISEIQDLSLYTRTLAELNYLHYFVWDLTPLLMSLWWRRGYRQFHPGKIEKKIFQQFSFLISFISIMWKFIYALKDKIWRSLGVWLKTFFFGNFNFSMSIF